MKKIIRTVIDICEQILQKMDDKENSSMRESNNSSTRIYPPSVETNELQNKFSSFQEEVEELTSIQKDKELEEISNDINSIYDSQKFDFEELRIEDFTQKENVTIVREEIKNLEEPVNVTIELLNNKPMTKLAEECVAIMDEFEDYSKRMDEEQAKVIANLVIERMQEALERCGLSRIENESAFSILRHIPEPMTRVPEGTILERTISPGLSLSNRVFRKAKVEIKD